MLQVGVCKVSCSHLIFFCNLGLLQLLLFLGFCFFCFDFCNFEILTDVLYMVKCRNA